MESLGFDSGQIYVPYLVYRLYSTSGLIKPPCYAPADTAAVRFVTADDRPTPSGRVGLLRPRTARTQTSGSTANRAFGYQSGGAGRVLREKSREVRCASNSSAWPGGLPAVQCQAVV